MNVIASLLAAQWRLKLFFTVVLNAFFWSSYSYLGNHAHFPLWTVPVTALDRWVPFEPDLWVWMYMSQYIFVAVLPWLLTAREALLRYAAGLLILSGISFSCFLFLPTAGPRPLEVGESAAMQLVARLDGPLNACPSLHAGFLSFMGLLAWRMFGRRAPWTTAITSILWGLGILYSTLATKQHYVLDLVAGTVLGCVADWLAWRGASRDSAAMTIPRSLGTTSQTGIS